MGYREELAEIEARVEAANKYDYWHPKITDVAWCKEIREEGYDEDDADLDDEGIRDHYADGAKYAVTWDHVGDAKDDWEPMADDWILLCKERAALLRLIDLMRGTRLDDNGVEETMERLWSEAKGQT